MGRPYRVSPETRRLLITILSATIVVVVLRLAFPGVDQFVLGLIELLKGTEIEPGLVVVAIGDTMLWTAIFIFSVVTAITQLAQFIETGVQERWKNAFEFLGITVVTCFLFLLSTALITDMTLSELL